MRVLFLSAANSIHTVRWVNTLAERGHEVHLVYNVDHAPSLNKLNEKIFCHRLEYGGTKAYYLNAMQLKRLVKSINPEVINVHYASGYGTLARLAGLKNTILSVWGSDVYDFPYESKVKKAILKKNVKNARKLASTSHCMARQLKKVMGDESLDVTITPFGVDLTLFNPEKFADIAHPEIVIGNIKALEDKYGIKELILSFAELKQRMSEKNFDKPLKLLIYGDGTQRKNIEQLIRANHLENDVKLMGRILNEKVPEALSGFDVFCALSKKESFGVAAVEAMAMKKAVVVSDAEGFREVVEADETGKIVPQNDVEAIEKALERLIIDDVLRKKYGEAGRKRVESLYDWQANVDIMENLYYEMKEKGSMEEKK